MVMGDGWTPTGAVSRWGSSHRPLAPICTTNCATRLVVLGTDHAYSKAAGNAAEAAAKALLESRGNAPRLYRNTLVFAAPDATRLQDLEQAVRDFLAWKSIVSQKDDLNLAKQQVTQAEAQLRAIESTVLARLPET